MAGEPAVTYSRPNVGARAYAAHVDTLPRPATPAETRALTGLFPGLLPPPPLHRYEVTVTVTHGPVEPPAVLPDGVNGAWSATKAVLWAVVDAVDQGSAARCALAALGDEAAWDAEVAVRALA